MDRGSVLAFLIVTLVPIPISRIFQVISPTPLFILLGGIGSLICLPVIVWLLSSETRKTHKLLAMVFSPLMFASAIDLIISLEYDGFISNLMSFYLLDGEPYLATAYSTAICYWDGIVHYALYWLMLYHFHKRSQCFRPISLFWFGTFFMSMIVLIFGSIAGPFPVHFPILLNTLYVIIPIGYLIWLLQSSPSIKESTTQLSEGPVGRMVDYMLCIMFMMYITLALVKGLGALGTNREIINSYISYIDQPVNHPYQYPKVTVLVYMFYGIPCCGYFIYCLMNNIRTSFLVDLSMVFAGLSANGQVGYLGVYFIRNKEHLEFDSPVYYNIFLMINLALLIVPQLFCFYCYHQSSVSSKESRRVKDKKKY